MARRAALDSLSLCLFKAVDIQAALNQVLSRKDLRPEDRALATELCYGYLRHRERIVFVLNRFLRKPGRLPKKISLALGVSCHELLFLDRVPAHASVDWAVAYAKSVAGSGPAGVCNAVLRKISGLGPDAFSEDFFRQDNPDQTLFWSRYYSCPKWLVALLRKSFGPKIAFKYLKASLSPPPLGLWFNFSRPGARDLFQKLSGHEACISRLDAGLAFASGAGLDTRDAEAEGLVSRMSLAGQEALSALGFDAWPEPVWDACAGRGGKTALMLSRTRGRIWASDVNVGRLLGLKQELRRLGLAGIPVFAARADRPPLLAESVGAVLVDAPCSGFGVLSRRPDTKYKRKPKDVTVLARLQSQILEQTYGALKYGGCLAYLTCTLTPEENEHQVERFIRSHPGAKIERTFATPPDSPLMEFFWGAMLSKG
ncbi:MAG: transcription antitermination factor NusB [Thermodesulfobacteriota bacterium]|nr:transcription antitermination factor NusB [Thermodesulfobacteriota bacterium]